ncbi:hypothetical protein [Proteiniphilum sp.]|uniref:hypothetical protein n=1 Tax=Proteiniphilum sp. TaxID=1926877 RepID=UPI0033180AD0
MKTKGIFLSVLLGIAATFTIQSQNTTYFAGYVYSEGMESAKQTMIPFATITFFDINDPDKIVATRISDLSGGYSLKGFDTDNIYIVKVNAPGIAEQSFITRPNKGQFKSGNISTHTCLKVDGEYQDPVKRKTYSPDDFSGDNNFTIMKMIEQISGLEVDHDEVITQEGGSIRIMLNGMNLDGPVFAELKELPTEGAVKSMDYYDLSGFEKSAYDGVLNIRVAMGSDVQAPNFELMSLKPYQK